MPPSRDHIIGFLLGMSDTAYRTAVRTLGSTQGAEDVVQDAYASALAHLPQMRSTAETRAWFTRVVTNAARTRQRSTGRRNRREAALPSRSGAASRTEELGRDSIAALGAAMNDLDEKYRLAVSLCYEQGFTRREAAAALGVPETTLADRVRTGLDQLRRRLAAAGFGAVVAALPAGLTHTAPVVPASLAGQVEALVAQGATKAGAGAAASAPAAKGGIAMKAVVGIILAVAVAGGVAVSMKGGGGGAPLPAEAPPTPKKGHKDWEYTTIGKVFVEHVAFSGSSGHLDGPAREGMSRTTPVVEADAAGNLYLVDIKAHAIRAVRKRGGRLFTLSGNGHITFGSPLAEGPAEHLRIGTLAASSRPYLATVGNPLEGEGSLYYAAADGQVVVRLFRNKAKGGRWWYERVAGLGSKKVGPGVPAAETKVRKPIVLATPDGKIGLSVVTGKDRRTLYWIRNGKLASAYDEGRVGEFACYGVDGAGNFVGTGGGGLKFVSPDGKVTKAALPWPVSWGIQPDRGRAGCFIKGMDDYVLTRVLPGGDFGTLSRAGTWRKCSGGSRPYRAAAKEWALNWAFGNPMSDGRYAASDGRNGPVFTATFPKGGE